ncbi:MAG: hypothetical protein Q8P24_20330 [Desulfobacterales bacterium]|nr:hypothetical protein [Desulfobacterales bacterium]
MSTLDFIFTGDKYFYGAGECFEVRGLPESVKLKNIIDIVDFE